MDEEINKEEEGQDTTATDMDTDTTVADAAANTDDSSTDDNGAATE